MKLSLEMTLDQAGEIKKQLKMQKTTVKEVCDNKGMPIS